jgi:hypothetical protein
LWRLWSNGELTADQAVGYMLQNLVSLFLWRSEVEKRLRALEQQARPDDPGARKAQT